MCFLSNRKQGAPRPGEKQSREIAAHLWVWQWGSQQDHLVWLTFHLGCAQLIASWAYHVMCFSPPCSQHTRAKVMTRDFRESAWNSAKSIAHSLAQIYKQRFTPVDFHWTFMTRARSTIVGQDKKNPLKPVNAKFQGILKITEGIDISLQCSWWIPCSPNT